MVNVHKDFDELFITYIEEHHIQLWPNRNSKGTDVISWTVSCPKPFTQVTHTNLKAAIVKLFFKLSELKWTQSS